MGPNILVVDDEASMRKSLARLLVDDGYSVRVADCAHAACREARKERPDLVLLDIRLPDTSGLEVLTRLKQMNQRVVVIVMTAYESTRDAVLAMKRGAYDYLSKPFNIDALGLLIKQALDNRQDRKERRESCTSRSGGTTRQGSACDRMIGTSPAMNSVLDIIHRLPAGSSSNVLIEGETGTGKEVLAHAIHEMNGQRAAPFVAIGCGAIPHELLESELFGYDKGAFTGARREGKQGAFEKAGAGTIFLDDIGELDLDLQVKLLRVLEAREFSRVGGVREIPLEARVIAATNRDLKQEVDGGRFRADLYFRLDVMRVRLPPLRERGGDIILLAEAFLREFNARFDKNFKTISPPARKLLESYAWPGNVRELRNVIERIVLLETGDTVLPCHLPSELLHSSLSGTRLPLLEGPSADMCSGSIEKERIVQALKRTGGNVVRAPSLLGVKCRALTAEHTAVKRRCDECGRFYAGVVARYISWTQKKGGDYVRERARELYETLTRDSAIERVAADNKARVLQNLTLNFLGVVLWAEFTGEAGILEEAEAQRMVQAHLEFLRTIFHSHVVEVSDERPFVLFLRHVRAMVEGEAARLSRIEPKLGGGFQTGSGHGGRGPLIGYEDDQHVYLLHDAVFKELSEYLARDRMDAGEFSKREVMRQLFENRITVPNATRSGTNDEKKHLIHVDGNPKRVVKISRAKF